jgi:2Fe-2S ferredoxin
MLPEVTFLPEDKKINVRAGTTLLEAGRKARVHIRSRCGGNASCLMCKVTVKDQSGLSAMKEKESMKLGELKERCLRLACQAKVIGSTVVEVPEDPLKAAVRAQLDQQNENFPGED